MAVSVQVDVEGAPRTVARLLDRRLDEAVIFGPGQGGLGVALRGFDDFAVGVEFGPPQVADDEVR
jgi:hypothetical protein